MSASSSSAAAAAASSLSVDAIIRRRVLSRESELGSLLGRWRLYEAALSGARQRSQQQQAIEAAVSAYANLLQALASLDFSLRRLSLVHSAVDCELSDCDRSASTSRQRTAALRDDIAHLRQRLGEATAERQHRLQVDAIAAQCNRMAGRADTAALLDALQADIARLDDERTAMQAEHDSRQRQFGLLALALDSISTQWRQQQRSTDRNDAMAVG